MVKKPMICIIDEDSNAVAPLKEKLVKENHRVELFPDPLTAFEHLETLQPELIVCELNLAEMDGLEFKQHYERRFPNRKTPFVFYTASRDRFSKLRAINMGTEAFYTKPEDPVIIAARIGAIIKKSNQKGIREFYGDLSKFSFVSIVRFCEEKLFSGDLVLWIGDSMEVMSFTSGKLDEENDMDLDASLEAATEAEEGMFLLRSRPFDFSEIHSAQVENVVGGNWYEEKKLGQLSFKLVQGNMFQIQTDFQGVPHNQIITRVFCRGKKVFQILSQTTPETDLDQISQLVKLQHIKVENKVHGDFEQDRTPKSAAPKTKEEQFYDLFQQGVSLSNNGDFHGALALWERAEMLEPENPLLKMNMRILKNRLQREKS